MKSVKNYLMITIQYMLMFLMFTFWPEYVLDTTLCRLFIIFLLLTLGLLKKHIAFNYNVFVILIILLGTHIAAIFWGSAYFSLDIGNFSALIISFIFISLITINEFCERFTKLIFFLSCYSLLTYVLNIIIPQLFWKLPNINATNIVANAIFSLVPIGHSNYPRNFGCWGEPGMFAVYLALALLLELFYKEQLDIKYLVIITITMITTFSTSGYFSASLLWFSFFSRIFYKNRKRLNKKVRHNILILIIIIVIGFSFLYSTGKLGNATYVFKKLTEAHASTGTTFERIRAIQLALQTIKLYLPFGCGWGIFASIYLSGKILTATPLNWFAVYGIIYGLLMNIGLIKFSSKLSPYFIQKIMIWLSIIAFAISQDLSSAFIFIIIIFYAYTTSNKYKLLQKI